jgi:hypothetical protein
MALTADQILAADDLGLKEVKVKEWHGSVFIRVMSVAERDAYERMWIGKKDSGVANFRTEYLVRLLCDEKGELLFTKEQIEKLGQKSGAVMARLFDAAIRHNAMSEADVEELGKG